MAGPTAAASPASSASRRTTRASATASSIPAEPAQAAETLLLDQAVSALRHALDDVRTGRHVKKAWNDLIYAYCRRKQSSPSTFPAWALATFGADTVLTCLQFEFGFEHLQNTYKSHRSDSPVLALSNWAGLSSPRLLALWFGADPVRTPSSKTLSALRAALVPEEPRPGAETGPADPSANLDTFSQACKAAIDSWAERRGIDTDLHLTNKKTASAVVTARKTCVFASLSTLSALGGSTSRSDRLLPQDFHTLSLPTRSKSSGKAMEDEIVVNGEDTVVNGEDTVINAEDTVVNTEDIVEASSSNLAAATAPKVARVAEASTIVTTTAPEADEMGVPVSKPPPPTLASPLLPPTPTPAPRLPTTPSTASASTINTSDLLSTSRLSIATTLHSPITPASPLDPGLSTERRLKRTHDGPDINSSPAKRSRRDVLVPALVEPEKMAAKEEEAGDAAAEKAEVEKAEAEKTSTSETESKRREQKMAVKEERAGEAAEKAEVEKAEAEKTSTSETESKRREAQMAVDDDISWLETHCHEKDMQVDQQSEEPAARRKGMEDTNKVMVSRLSDDKAWLGGETIDRLLSLAVSSSSSCATVTNLLLKKIPRARDRDETLKLRQLFLDADGKPVDTVIVGINTGSNHWVLVTLSVSDRTATVYNSLPPTTDKMTAELADDLSALAGLLYVSGDGQHSDPSQQQPEIKVVVAPRAALQSDTHNCGVFAVVNAFFLAAGRTPPGSLDAPLWRRLLLALATESSLASKLPQELVTLDLGQQAARLHAKLQQQEQPLDTTSPLELVLSQNRRTCRLWALWLQSCTDLDKRLSTTLQWLRDEVGPLLAHLKSAAEAEVSRLEDVVHTLEEDSGPAETLLRTAQPRLGQVKAMYEQLEKNLRALKRAQVQRLAHAKMCAALLDKLDLQETIRVVEETRQANEEQAERAREMAPHALDPRHVLGSLVDTSQPRRGSNDS